MHTEYFASEHSSSHDLKSDQASNKPASTQATVSSSKEASPSAMPLESIESIEEDRPSTVDEKMDAFDELYKARGPSPERQVTPRASPPRSCSFSPMSERGGIP